MLKEIEGMVALLRLQGMYYVRTMDKERSVSRLIILQRIVLVAEVLKIHQNPSKRETLEERGNKMVTKEEDQVRRAVHVAIRKPPLNRASVDTGKLIEVILACRDQVTEPEIKAILAGFRSGESEANAIRVFLCHNTAENYHLTIKTAQIGKKVITLAVAT